MTVKELKKILNQYDNDLVVMIPNRKWTLFGDQPLCVEVDHVSKGILGKGLFMCDFEEDEKDEDDLW